MENSAGIILFRERLGPREYLLLFSRHITEFWSFSKGTIEEGESEEQAALREAKEETNLEKIELVPGFYGKTTFFKKREGKIVFKEVVWFLGKVHDQSDGKVSAEHTALQWLPYGQALKLIKHKNDKVLLKKAEEKLVSLNR